MSTTVHLVCLETGEELWVGQGHLPDVTIYADDAGEVGRFLLKTAGKTLKLMSCHEYEARFPDGPVSK